VLVAHDGVVKLTDFGIAKATEQKPNLTRPGMLKGKVSYMSPEQCRDEPLDRRSDIFSLGILLYELTTLETPFPGTSDFAIMEQIVHRDAQSPADTRADYPAQLAAVVMRALARDREQRFATAQEVQRELLRIARAHGIENSPFELESYLRDLFGAVRVDAWRRAFVESSIAISPTAATVLEGAVSVRVPSVRPRRWPFAIAALGVAAAIAGVAIARRSDDQAAASATTQADPPAQATPAPPLGVAAPAQPAAEVAQPVADVAPPAVAPPAAAAPPDPPRRATQRTRPSRPSKDTPAAAEVEPVSEPPKPVSEPKPMSEPPKPAVSEPPKVIAPPPPPVAPADAATAPVREVPWDPDSPEFPKKR
jgi:hypothetical protein